MKQIKWRYHGYLWKSAYEGEGEEPTVLLDSAAARLVKITEIENKVSFPYEIVFQIREKRQKNDK